MLRLQNDRQQGMVLRKNEMETRKKLFQLEYTWKSVNLQDFMSKICMQRADALIEEQRDTAGCHKSILRGNEDTVAYPINDNCPL